MHQGFSMQTQAYAVFLSSTFLCFTRHYKSVFAKFQLNFVEKITKNETLYVLATQVKGENGNNISAK